MKRFFGSILFALLFFHGTQAQVLNPVKWTFASEKVNKHEVDLVFKAAIDEGWHMYGLNMPDGGPYPVSFNYDTIGFEIAGKPRAIIKPEVKLDEILGLELEMLDGKGLFRQRIKRESSKAFTVTGNVEYMACNDRTCTPPIETAFSIKVGALEEIVVEAPAVETHEQDTAVITQADTNLTQIAVQQTEVVLPGEELKAPVGEGKKTLWGIVLLSLIAGLGALLTPCVYPMIPLTVSFFMRGNKSRAASVAEALVFGVSIIIIYTLLGVLVALFKDPNAVNTVSTHWLLNAVFFVVFVVLAASFFGLFELVLPGSIGNSIDRKADRGGLAGAFFMALGMTILSFSCTGPIVAGLLIKASEGEVMEPVAGMFSFGLIFAIPFTLFAIFPSWLKGLPKSGGWLNSIKVFFAFIMLAFSFYFLNKIDQAYHLNILTREVFIGFWIVVFALLGLYLLGKIRFAHDSETSTIGVPRFLLAVAVFTFVLYLVPGLFGADLKVISPLLPPKDAQQFDLSARSNNLVSSIKDDALCGTPKYADMLHLPHGLKGYFDYNEALACAKEKNKPVLLDFVGHTCANCKKMYENVWSQPEILSLLQDKFIIVALYTDDKTKLPEDEWYTSANDNRLKNTIGKKNVDFQISKFGSNALPLYAIVDADGNIITEKEFYVYSPDAEGFKDFLEEGLKNFSNKVVPVEKI
ncbi:MAG: thioredoxin family protein [Bacteroidales bacterium]|nr:thioredoxin family protein [Bacteroidales bacterium]